MCALVCLLQVFLSLRDTWVKFVENEARIWVEFHKFWLNKRSEAPILMVRYEDLMQDSEVSAHFHSC